MLSVSICRADPDKIYAHHMVRTDSREQKLDAFLQRAPTTSGSTEAESTSAPAARTEEAMVTLEEDFVAPSTSAGDLTAKQ